MIETKTYPLQSRVCYLTPEHLISSERIERALSDFADRGYNGVVVPVLHMGSMAFRTCRDGTLREGSCPGREALEILRDYDFTVYLGVDILRAGPPGSRAFGDLAHGNRGWLMKTALGKFRISQYADLPGLFCWCTIDYRRFIGNLLVDIAQAFPIDGVIFDLRFLPRTTLVPESWSHLGYNSLQRIQDEIGLDLETFLNNPTVETLQDIERWRVEQLQNFLENLKARLQRIRHQLVTVLMARVDNPDDPYVPWMKPLSEGVLEELFLLAKPEDAPNHSALIDSLMPEPRIFQLVVDHEKELANIGEALHVTSAAGFCVLQPDPRSRAIMPPHEMDWACAGVPESHPVVAGKAIIHQLSERLKTSVRLSDFFQKLEVYLEGTAESMKHEDAQKIRHDIVRIMKRIRDEEKEFSFDRIQAVRQLDLVSRLLLLTPIQSYEY